MLIVDEHFAPMVLAIRQAAPRLHTVIVIGSDREQGELNYHSWLMHGEPCEDVRRGVQALATILYTGGTTGRPKGVMLSHANVLASAMGYLSFPGARPGSSYLHVAPLFHIGAQSALYSSMLAGTAHVFVPQFDPERALAAIRRERVTNIFLVPTMLAAMMLEPSFRPARAGSLRRIVYGASPIDSSLLERAMKVLPDVGFRAGLRHDQIVANCHNAGARRS